jgi:hypothetical protein
MKTLFLASLSAAALLCAAAPAGAQTVVPTSSSHEATSHAFVYDTVWRDTIVRDDAISSTAFDIYEAAETQIGATYQAAEGKAYLFSQVEADSVYAEVWATSSAIDYHNGQATAANAGSSRVAFTLPARARASFYYELGAWATAQSNAISASLSFAGPGGTVFAMSLDGGGGDNGTIYRYLQAGAYVIDGDAAAELTADQFAGSHDSTDQANGQFIGWLHVFCPADFEADGDVDPVDYNAFDDLWGQGSLEADVNGDGAVDGADYDAYEAAYLAGC